MHLVSAGPRQTADGALGWTKRRSLLASCVAHALHDGYTDLICVLLPIWQTQFGIGYAALAVLRALYMGALAGLQLPSNKLAERFGDKTILVLGTAVAAIGYAIAGLTASLLGLGIALALAGVGSGVLPGISTSLVAPISPYCWLGMSPFWSIWLEPESFS
jgi:MFS transporter, FSR family, fosmidomycin resistance protein